MPRYIDADDLFNLIQDCVSAPYEESREVKDEVLEIIAEKKGCDVQEVKHGKWKRYSDLANVRCSLCERFSILATDFCPNCGARMDQEEIDKGALR